MSKLTKKQVLHIASISNIKLTEEEIEKFTPQLDKIIEFVEILNEVDTKDVSPTIQTTGIKNVLREDVVKPENILTEKEALSGTEDVYNNLVKVPAILTERATK